RLRGLEIDYELELGRSLNGQVGRLLSPQNSPGVDAGLTIRIRKVGSVAHEPAREREITHRIDCRNRMARRERNDLIAARQEERVDVDIERVAALLGHRRERGIGLAFASSSQNNVLQPKGACSRLHISQLALGIRKVWINECRDEGDTGNEFAQQPQSLRSQFANQAAYARRVAARPVQAGD